MQAKPLLSIIVPTFNRDTLIIPTLDSLLNQDNSNYEIIVVDDGSTDNTESVVKKRFSKATHINIAYYKISNRERGAARNYGVSKSIGKFVNFFDSDDIAYKNHVSIFEEIVSEYDNFEVFALSYDIMNSDNVILNSKILKRSVSHFITHGNDLSCNGVFIKREIVLQNPFSEDRTLSGSEDYDLWLRLASKYVFPCFPRISHAIIQHNQRSTMNFNPETLIKRKLLMLELAFNDEFVSKRFSSSKNEMESSAYSYIALHIAMAGKSKKESLKWFWKGIYAKPTTIFTRRTLAVIKHLVIP